MPSLDNTKNPMAVTAPTGGIPAGGFKLVSGTLFYCPEAIAAATSGAGYWKEKIIRGSPKAAGGGLGWVKGQRLYWNGTAWTTAATGNGIVRGMAANIAATGDTTGDVELLGLVG